MPRTLSHSRFSRRIRTELAKYGVEASVELVPNPDWNRWMTPLLAQVTTASPEGPRILHHSFSKEPTLKDVARIVYEHAGSDVKPAPLVSAASQVPEGVEALPGWCAIRFGNNTLVYRRVRVMDVMAQERVVTISLDPHDPGSSEQDRYSRKLLKSDARNRSGLKGGELTVTGALATVLRSLPDAQHILDRLVEGLATDLDQKDLEYKDTTIDVESVEVALDGLAVQARRGQISLLHYDLSTDGSVTYEGQSIRLHGGLSHTVAAGLKGRRIGDVIAGLPIDNDLKISGARPGTRGSSIRLEVPAISLSRLRAELAGEPVDKAGKGSRRIGPASVAAA